MLWCKKIAVFIIPICLSYIYSCRGGEKTIAYHTADTAKINRWLRNCDSLYEKYTDGYDTGYGKKLVAIIDSLENSERYLLTDTLYTKNYIKQLLRKALCLYNQNDFTKSGEFFDRYLFLYNEHKLNKPASLAFAQTYLGNIYSRYGDYVKATSLFHLGLKYYRGEKSQDNIGFAILSLAIALKELEQYREAESMLLEIFGFASISQKRKAKACIELADIYTRQNRLTEAGSRIQKAREFLDSVPQAPDRTETFTTLLHIEGDWQMANHRPQEALKAYHLSLDSAMISSAPNLRDREIGKTYIAMGKALEQLNLIDSALYYYNRALFTVINVDTLDNLSLPRQQDIYAENTIAEALFARAGCISKYRIEKIKELENAINCWQLAFETESKLLNAFSYDQSRLFMAEETRKEVEKAIGACYRLFQLTKDARWASQAFLFAEHNKSFVLNESVKRNIAASKFMREDRSDSLMRSMQSNMAATEIELNQRKFSKSPDSSLISKLSAEKQGLEEKILQLENEIRTKNPQYTKWISNDTGLTAPEMINRVIDKNTVMAEYFTGDSATYLFSASKEGPLSFTRLSPGLEKASEQFLGYFSNRNRILNDPPGYASMANQLYDLLLGAVNNQDKTSLLIIPDGFISLIPFDALLTGKATTIDMASLPYLIKRFRTTYSFSCKTILIQQQASNKFSRDQVAAFAPVFANKERGLPSLLHSKEELQAIMDFRPGGNFYTGPAATLRQFKTGCSNASIIHLATHASAGNDSSIAGIEFYDSTLYLNTIYSLPLKARLVVLSGCETGAGTVNKTEGLMSLARGFSYAGTPNVIAGLWQTEDQTAGELFKDFYSDLSNNTISGSLQKAKLKLIQTASVSQSSPFYWAGYTYIGIPGEKITGHSGKLTILLLVTLVLFLSGIVIMVKKSKQATRAMP